MMVGNKVLQPPLHLWYVRLEYTLWAALLLQGSLDATVSICRKVIVSILTSVEIVAKHLSCFPPLDIAFGN